MPIAHPCNPLPRNMILVSRKKHPKIYHERIHKLFFNAQTEEPTKQVYIQGVGAALETAVNLALDAQAKYAGVSVEVETFTMPVTDEIVIGK